VGVYWAGDCRDWDLWEGEVEGRGGFDCYEGLVLMSIQKHLDGEHKDLQEIVPSFSSKKRQTVNIGWRSQLTTSHPCPGRLWI